MIYVVEDDTSIRELIVYTLNSMNLKTVGFEKPSDFWDQLDSEIPTLVMLDIMLPEENGIDILKKLRKRVDTKALPYNNGNKQKQVNMTELQDWIMVQMIIFQSHLVCLKWWQESKHY